ncbi:MAG: peptidoglycan synthetase [Bacteroidetes bacterium]|nr:peptidoglycan synthetase [Bacteroidota bacterium]
MHIHFIAIGGAAMHNLALAMHHKGYIVSGSDDEINEPSRSRLAKYNLLPSEMGWFPQKLNAGIDAVILGMHARVDNPELLRAQELGLKIFSYPEYIYEQSKNKKRIVIGGSHGKTTITSMIMHVLKNAKMDFDYLVGSQIAGFDTMVRLTDAAPFIIVEGDEYLASPIDRRPKFHLYQAHTAVISGIAWDHINVFPTYEDYKKQFQIFAEQIPADGKIIYCSEDIDLCVVMDESKILAQKIKYSTAKHETRNGTTYIHHDGKEYAMQVFGHHNLLNMEAARNVCTDVGISDALFYELISSFTGAARRLELIGSTQKFAMYKDFAHSPSKVDATVKAVKSQFEARTLIACLELHTFSSLNETFLKGYTHTLDAADVAYVYFNPHTIEHKKLKPISVEYVAQCFVKSGLKIFTDSNLLKADLMKNNFDEAVLLMMSSGNFDGWNFEDVFSEIELLVV